MRIGKARTGRAVLVRVVLCLNVLGMSSCGPSGPKLVPVQGKVTLIDGTPITYGHVVLHPDASKGNSSKNISQGTIQNGSYTIMTGAKQGAPLGAYKVGIEAAKEVDPNNPYFTEWLADEKYVDPNRSGLTMEVEENPEPNRYDFKLNPHAPQKKK
jgi:hypothetical protein